jgi:hypothetical protein
MKTRTQRSLPLRQRQEVQAVLREVTGFFRWTKKLDKKSLRLRGQFV